jgi:hypothetical protein
MKKYNCLKCNKIIEQEKAIYGLHPECFSKWFSAKSTDEFLDVARQQSSSDDSARPLPSDWWNSSFFQGKFLKYSAELAGKAYIIKLEEDIAPTGKIATKETLEPTTKDYVREFIRLNYLSEVLSFFDRVNLKKIEKLIQQSHCSELMKNAIQKLFLKRYQEMKDALQS